MSYTLVDNKIFEDKTLKHTEFRVLLFLIRNYNIKKGYSYPTRAQIIKSCKINKDTLGTVLKSLEAKGYITRKNNPIKSGKNTIYLIHKYLVGISKNNNKESEVDTMNGEVEEDIEDSVEQVNDKKIIDDCFIDKIDDDNTDDQDLKQKIETVQSVIGKPINKGFVNIISKLTWDELVQIDMSLVGKDVNQTYYLEAIYRVRPDLKCII